MSQAQYPIVPPIEKTREPYLFSKMNIELTQLDLGVSANFLVYLFGEDGNLLTVKDMKMEGEDYQKWKSDDYVPEWVINQLRK